MSYTKPLPQIDTWNRPFWEACADRRLIAQRCDASGTVWFPPAPVSPVTRTAAWSWVELSGRGTVWSFVVMHQNYFKGFADEIPYNVAQVRLDEGPMLITNIVDAGPGGIEIGMPVRVVFEPCTDAITLPKFTPAR